MRKTILIAFTLFSLALAAAPPSNENRGPSTPEERQRFVAIAHKLEQSPLDKSLHKDREWALRWLIEVPDVHVSICTTPLGDFMGSKYKYSPEIVGQLTFSSGVFAIEHLGQPADQEGQYVAGVEGALRAYQAILTSQPDAKSKALDDLLQKQKEGTLADYVRETSKTGCKSSGDRSSS